MIESVCELIGEVDTDYEELTGEASIQTIEIQPVLQEKEVNPTKEGQIVMPDEGYNGLSQVTVNPIVTNYQEKEITPSKEGQIIIPDDGYDALSQVTINPIVTNYQEKEITPTKETQTLTPDEGYDALSRVEVKPIPDNYIEMTGSIYNTEDATATANDILIGKTAYTANGKVVGQLEISKITLKYVGNGSQNNNFYELYIDEDIQPYSFYTSTTTGYFTLSKVTTGDNCNMIYTKAFQNQKKCLEYDFRRGVTTLNGTSMASAFGSNAVVRLGEQCTNIGSQAMYDSPKYLYCYAVNPPALESFNFRTLTYLVAIYVPDESVDLYKSATNWSAVASYIKPLSEAEDI